MLVTLEEVEPSSFATHDEYLRYVHFQKRGIVVDSTGSSYQRVQSVDTDTMEITFYPRSAYGTYYFDNNDIVLAKCTAPNAQLWLMHDDGTKQCAVDKNLVPHCRVSVNNQGA